METNKQHIVPASVEFFSIFRTLIRIFRSLNLNTSPLTSKWLTLVQDPLTCGFVSTWAGGVFLVYTTDDTNIMVWYELRDDSECTYRKKDGDETIKFTGKK